MNIPEVDLPTDEIDMAFDHVKTVLRDHLTNKIAALQKEFDEL